jgi:hypothetical protein
MPFMSVNEFERRTSVLLAVRGDRLKDIARKLNAYNLAPTVDNLDDLRKALKNWKMAHNAPSNPDAWKTDRRNTGKGQGNPIEELDGEVNRQYREEARTALAEAVRALDRTYGAALDPAYRKDMLATLHNTVPHAPRPLDCFVWFRSTVPLGRSLWENLLKAVGATDDQGKTDGLTVPRDAGQAAGLNAKLDANNVTADCAVVGRYATRGDDAPGNRVISVSTLSRHTVVHELLHWVTHETFRKFTYDDIKDAMLGKFIREGLTEWLTRSGLNEWDKGGYVDLVPVWQDIMASNAVSVADLTAAFFRGKDVKGVCVELGKVTAKNTLYQTTLAGPRRQQLMKMMGV